MTGLEVVLILVCLVVFLFAAGFWLEAHELSKRHLELQATVTPSVDPINLDDYIHKDTHELQLGIARKEAIANSRAVNKGFVYEELAPHWQKDFDPKDFHHMGAPIDYLVIDGANDFLEGRSDDIRGVVLFEVKTGNARMSKIQRLIRDAVKAGKVRFIVSHIDSGKEVVSPGKPPEAMDDIPSELDFIEPTTNGDSNVCTTEDPSRESSTNQ